MKNTDKWIQKRFFKNKKGHFTGPHMQRIVGVVYESAIGKYAKGKLADLGCGDVPYYPFYKDIAEDITCVDWSNCPFDLSFCDIETDLNQILPLESNTFDTVLSTDVIEHIAQPHVFFNEMARILKPGGYLILGTPFLYWIHDEKHDYHRFTNHMLAEFCRSNNLRIVELKAYGGLPEVIFDLIHKGYRVCKFRGSRIFYPIWESIGAVLSKSRFVKKISQKTKSEFPLGYILVAIKN